MPEIHCQADGGIFTKAVLAFSKRVNNTTDTPSEAVTTKAFILENPAPTDPPTITGTSGKTQGAKTVSTPDKKETINKNIIILFQKQEPKGSGYRSIF